jgi:hypothetical protein
MENGKQSAFTGIVNEACQPGLTKREYFAGLAMQGILSGLPRPLEAHRKTVSEKAIQLADELLKQLENNGKS